MSTAILKGTCSNRTFMELKFGRKTARYSMMPGSNRTFMELKWTIEEEHMLGSLVLIVPLWN